MEGKMKIFSVLIMAAMAAMMAVPAQAREPAKSVCAQKMGAPSPDGTPRECAQSGRAWGLTVPDGT